MNEFTKDELEIFLEYIRDRVCLRIGVTTFSYCNLKSNQ